MKKLLFFFPLLFGACTQQVITNETTIPDTRANNDTIETTTVKPEINTSGDWDNAIEVKDTIKLQD